jgi:hypothetical protein
MQTLRTIGLLIAMYIGWIFTLWGAGFAVAAWTGVSTMKEADILILIAATFLTVGIWDVIRCLKKLNT